MKKILLFLFALCLTYSIEIRGPFVSSYNVANHLPDHVVTNDYSLGIRIMDILEVTSTSVGVPTADPSNIFTLKGISSATPQGVSIIAGTHTTNGAGGNATLGAGAGAGAGAGGTLTLSSGAGAASGAGGNISISAGAGGNIGGNGGTITILAGAGDAAGGVPEGVGGDVIIYSGSGGTSKGVSSIEGVTFNAGAITSPVTVNNININGSAITGVSDANTTITAYAGKAVAIEGVSFDGTNVSGMGTLDATGQIETTSTDSDSIKTAGGITTPANGKIGTSATEAYSVAGDGNFYIDTAGIAGQLRMRNGSLNNSASVKYGCDVKKTGTDANANSNTLGWTRTGDGDSTFAINVRDAGVDVTALSIDGANGGNATFAGKIETTSTAVDSIKTAGGIQGTIASDADSDTDDVLTTIIPDTAYGLVIVRESTGTEACVFLIAGGTIEKIGTDATFTVTKDNASTYNVYFETNVIKVQNKVGDDKNIAVGLYSI